MYFNVVKFKFVRFMRLNISNQIFINLPYITHDYLVRQKIFTFLLIQLIKAPHYLKLFLKSFSMYFYCS